MSRVALVTGAGQGIGRAIALGLSEAGLAVAAVGRTLSKVEDTVGRLPGEAIALAADLTDPEQVRGAFKAVADRFGGLDVLVHCAAAYNPFRIDEASDVQITDMVAQSLTSAVFCTRDAVELMRRRGGGDIVHISSQSADMPQPFMTVYGACKAGVETLCQGLRYELKGEDFRVMVCQIGVIAETVPKPGSGYAENRERIWDAWRRTGIAGMYAYPGSPADGVAAAVVHALMAPRDVHVHTISLRGAEVVEG